MRAEGIENEPPLGRFGGRATRGVTDMLPFSFSAVFEIERDRAGVEFDDSDPEGEEIAAAPPPAEGGS